METVCMHCRKLRTPRGRWIRVPDKTVDELRDTSRLSYGCCFACTRELFGVSPEQRTETRLER